MRTMLIALCIHGLALGPALADSALPPMPEVSEPKGVAQAAAAAERKAASA